MNSKRIVVTAASVMSRPAIRTILSTNILCGLGYCLGRPSTALQPMDSVLSSWYGTILLLVNCSLGRDCYHGFAISSHQSIAVVELL